MPKLCMYTNSSGMVFILLRCWLKERVTKITYPLSEKPIANAICYDTQNESKSWLMDTTNSVKEHGGIDQLEGSLLLTRGHDAYRY